MKLSVFKNFIGILLADRSSWKFGIGMLLGFAFSIAVVLCTIGIMDGFDYSLKRGLKKSVGDIVFYSRDGFFYVDGKIKEILSNLRIRKFSPYVRTQGFAMSDEVSMGVRILGVDSKLHSSVTGLSLDLSNQSISIGIELAKKFQLNIGDELVLGFANGNSEFESLPLLKRFKVGQILNHGIYEKDLRIIYVDRTLLQNSLRIDQQVNVVAINAPLGGINFSNDTSNYTEKISYFVRNLKEHLGPTFNARPFWSEFSGLLEAVRVQKFMIGIIFQLIVVIAVFNVLAFIIFLNEKRSREIFLFMALGVGKKRMIALWLTMVLFIWGFACALSIGFVRIFDMALLNLSFFELPGNVYYLGRFSILLGLSDYLLVFSLAFLWPFIISLIALLRISRKSILSGLRREFA